MLIVIWRIYPKHRKNYKFCAINYFLTLNILMIIKNWRYNDYYNLYLMTWNNYYNNRTNKLCVIVTIAEYEFLYFLSLIALTRPNILGDCVYHLSTFYVNQVLKNRVQQSYMHENPILGQISNMKNMILDPVW